MKPTRFALAVAWIIGVSTSVAQGPRGRDSGPPPVKVGSELADVTAYNEKGEAFPLQQKLKGRHAVIVFGCLT